MSYHSTGVSDALLSTHVGGPCGKCCTSGEKTTWQLARPSSIALAHRAMIKVQELASRFLTGRSVGIPHPEASEQIISASGTLTCSRASGFRIL